MKAQSKTLNNHEENVGRDHYNKTGYTMRPEFIQMTQKKESPMKIGAPNNEERDIRMKEAEVEDAKTRREAALNIVKKSRTKKSFTLDKQRRVKPDQRSFLQEFFCNEKSKDLASKKFPGIY